jgi:glycosyltransferase involved in cell wall biosynthesis
MRVCLISVEIFAWGKHGGFGKATRLIGRELVKRGIEVFAVVPRRGNQHPVEILDGITVLGFNRFKPWEAAALLRHCDADIYHSQEPSFATFLARRAMPDRKHVVTSRDPKELRDWWTEWLHPSLNRLQVFANYLYEDNPLVGRAVRRADRVFCAAEFLRAKAARKYRLSRRPDPLPTPVVIPSDLSKSERPTVCYLARWDRRKRPELFLELARQFPEVRFIAVGRSRDAEFERGLRARYANLPNLEMPGYLDPFDAPGLSSILSPSWIMVNTALREGLPNAFLEAGAHGCAILSGVDPGGFTSRFGVLVQGDDFASGLARLIEDERWRECGERARAHVRDMFELESVLDRHLAIYHEMLNGKEPTCPSPISAANMPGPAWTKPPLTRTPS